MPSVKNPSSLISGGGFATGVVPTAKLQEPSRDIASLTAHLTDPSRAHMASAIGIVDAGGFYSADQVEGALQEIAAGHSAGRQNGVFAKCTLAASGLTLTIGTNSSILIQGVLRDVSGLTVTCPAIAGTYYVYFTTSGVLTIESGLPSLAGESIMIAQVTCDGAAVTDLRDARFFVANLDRKLDYTARSDGSSANNSSEACFVTLEAAFFWLENYYNQDIKKTLIIRGGHTITSSLVIPTSNVTIRGEGGASIDFTGGAESVLDIPNVSGTVVENLTFICNSTSAFSYAIRLNDAANTVISACNFTSGAAEFTAAVWAVGDLTNGLLLRDCKAESAGGFDLHSLGGKVRVENCSVDFPGLVAGSGGFRMQNTVALDCDITYSGCTVRNSTAGFTLASVSLGFDNNVRFLDCHTYGTGMGLAIDAGSGVVVTGCSFDLSDTYTYGITLNAPECIITGCRVVTARDPSSYEDSHFSSGIRLNGSATNTTISSSFFSGFRSTSGTAQVDGLFSIGAQGLCMTGCVFQDSSVAVTGVTIMGTTLAVSNIIISNNVFSCTVDGEAPSSPALGVYGASGVSLSGNRMNLNHDGLPTSGRSGILVAGGVSTFAGVAFNTGSARDVSITGNSISGAKTCALKILGDVNGFVLSSNTVDGYLATSIRAVGTGIHVVSNDTKTPTSGTVVGNTVRRCENGIILQGGAAFALRLRGVAISANSVSDCVQTSSDEYTNFDLIANKGIGIQYASDCIISSNDIRNMGITKDNSGVVIQPLGTISSIGVCLFDCSRINVTSNTVTDLYVWDSGVVLGTYYGVFWQILESVHGPEGRPDESDGIQITDNIINVIPAVDTGAGPPAFPSSGIRVRVQPDAGDARWHGLLIEGNEINTGVRSDTATYGICATASGDALDVQNWSIENNAIMGFLESGIYLSFAGDSGVARTIRVTDNTVQHYANTTNEKAIYVSMAVGPYLQDVRVDRNDISSDVLGHHSETGISIFSMTPTIVSSGISISDNRIHATKFCISLICIGPVETATVRNNRVVGVLTGPNAILIQASASVAESLTVTENDVTFGAGVCTENNTTAIKVRTTSGLASAFNDNIIVTANAVHGTLVDPTGFVGVSVGIGSYANVIEVSNNKVTMPTSTGGTSEMEQGIALFLEGSHDGPVSWRSVDFSHNSVYGDTSEIPSPYVGPTYNGALVLDTNYAVPDAVVVRIVGLTMIGNSVHGHINGKTGIVLITDDTSVQWVLVGNSAVGYFVNATGLGGRPVNSICTSNISNDGGAGGFNGPFFTGFAVYANNLDY